MYFILVINPGATSTRIAIFEDETEAYAAIVPYPREELAGDAHVVDQYPLRRDAVLKTLSGWGIAIDELDAVVGRGGCSAPYPVAHIG